MAGAAVGRQFSDLADSIQAGCTSGNGLSGNAMASPASLVATLTFVVTGIAATFITETLI